MGVASETGAIVNQIRMGWKAPPSSICPVCSMSAFPAESYMAADRTPYHKACLKCNQCCKRLTPSSMAEHDKMLYCDNCYQLIFIEKAGNAPADRVKMQVFLMVENINRIHLTMQMKASDSKRRWRQHSEL